MEYKTKLLATFADEETLHYKLGKIYYSFDVENDRVFVFQNMDTDNKYILSYNIFVKEHNTQSLDEDVNSFKKVRNTLFIHRKKESNTLFTIDGLNSAVKEQNNGELNPNFQLNWDNYRDCLLVERSGSLCRVNIILKEIVNLKKYMSEKRNNNSRFNSN